MIESGAPSGDWRELGEWQRGRMGEVCTIMLFLWLRPAARRDTDSSFCGNSQLMRRLVAILL